MVAPGAVSPQSIGQEFIPPEHWSYDALDRFEALGLVRLPSETPFSRPQIIGFVREIEANVARSNRTLGSRERYNRDRLVTEFTASGSLENPKTRFDPPVLFLNEKPFFLEGDVDLSVAPSKPLFDDRWWVYGVSNLSAKLHIRELFTYEVRYRLVYGPERDDRVHKAKLSPRERSWNGLTSLYERAYVVFRWKKLTLFGGRDYEDWGPTDRGNLIVSRTAGSLDKIGGRLAFKNLRLSFFHSYLTVEETRRTLSAHRLEFDVRSLTFGLSETVLYTGRGIDPVYALPLSAFYANQYNERGDDNVIWADDVKYRARSHVLLYGSLLIDDFQFERDGTAPDMLGFDLGGRFVLSNPVPLTVRLEYRYVDIYTYTHRDSLKYHVTGRGDPLAGDAPLGAIEGPDGDVARLEADYFPRPSVTTSAFMTFRRRGEGNDYRKHEPGLDPSPPFPSGVVEETLSFGLGLRWEFERNSSAGLAIEHAIVRNRDHQPDADDNSTMFRAFFIWDL